jgi:hypothetical protein
VDRNIYKTEKAIHRRSTKMIEFGFTVGLIVGLSLGSLIGTIIHRFYVAMLLKADVTQMQTQTQTQNYYTTKNGIEEKNTSTSTSTSTTKEIPVETKNEDITDKE